MTFGTATINSAVPAKDLMAALAAPLTTAGLVPVETYASPATNASWQSMAYGNGVYVAVAANTSTAATSSDGTTWTQRTLPASGTWMTVTFGAGLFVTVAQNSNMAATSPDGITWTLRTMPANAAWRAVTYGGGRFVAVCNSALTTAYSLDGITWTAGGNLPATHSWQAIGYGAGAFLAFAGSNAAYAISTDGGVSWTQRSMPLNATYTAIVFGASGFVAVNNGGANVHTSADGLTFTARTLPAGLNGLSWNAAAYVGGQYVMVANGSAAAATSPDGVTWTQRALPSTQNWSALASNGGTGLAALATSSSSGAAASSGDTGATWQARTASGTSNSPIADVYRSPAASNTFGSDWYLILRRASDSNVNMFYQVAENYDPVTHRASNIGGTAQAVIPVAGTYANPANPVAPDQSTANSASLTLTAGTAFQYWVSATADRVVVGVRTTAESGFYAGLYDDLLPAGVTGFPLVCVKTAPDLTVNYPIGYGISPSTGGFTREPLQTAASAQNFEAGLPNGNLRGPNTSNVFPSSAAFTPMTTTQALYGNTNSLSRVPVGSTRTVVNSADAYRGLLIGCVTSLVNSVAGDTITSAGKTYVRFAGPTATYGYFVDQAL